MMPKRYTRFEKRELAGLTGRSILDVALEVHMGTTGASDYTSSDRKRDIRTLRTVLLTWDWSNFCLFDWLVHRLVVEALREAGQKIPASVTKKTPNRPRK